MNRMSKFILTGDMPKSCSECGFKRVDNDSYNEWYVCNRTGIKVDRYKDQVHPQCPLQDTTELLEALERIALNKNVKTMTYEKYDIDKPRESIYFSDDATTVILDKDYNKLKQFFEGVMKNERKI
jgi:hypothetical protein